MNQTALHLVESVIPRVPVRQWVLLRGGRVVGAEPQRTRAQQTPGYGFDLHAGVRIAARDRGRLERLCRYILSPPVSAHRISRTADGRVAYRLKRRWSDGTEVVYFSPLDFMSKLMALMPRPRVHLIRYHGCLAPRSSLRRKIVPSSATAAARQRTDGKQLRLIERPRQRWIPRVELLRHVFGAGAACCRACGSNQLEVVAVVRRWDAIASVLASFGLSTESRALTRNRGPPRGHWS